MEKNEKFLTCKHCESSVLDFSPSLDAITDVVSALRRGSTTLAAAELAYHAECTTEAQTWVAHALTCRHAWPYVDSDNTVLHQIDLAFANVSKPEHFTNYTCCGECKEHDDTLRSHDRATIRREDLGSIGWSPMRFSSDEGIG